MKITHTIIIVAKQKTLNDETAEVITLTKPQTSQQLDISASAMGLSYGFSTIGLPWILTGFLHAEGI